MGGAHYGARLLEKEMKLVLLGLMLLYVIPPRLSDTHKGVLLNRTSLIK